MIYRTNLSDEWIQSETNVAKQIRTKVTERDKIVLTKVVKQSTLS